MKVGGVVLHPDYFQRLVVGVLSFAAVLGALVSFSSAVLFFTTFCFGAGLLSLALDLCKGHQLPNLLPSLKPTNLVNPYTCGHCKSLNCRLHYHVEPWYQFEIPVEIDRALQEFFEKILREYVYSWYRELSYDEDFVQEIRYVIRHATAIIIKRIYAIDITQLITRKAIPLGLKHVDDLYNATRSHPNKIMRMAFIDFMGSEIHPAVLNRGKEVEYVRNISNKVLPFLVPTRILNSRPVRSLIIDVLSGAVLQPLIDLLPNPDASINLMIELGFSPDPSRKFGPSSGKRVEFLREFVRSQETSQPSALQMDLSAILKDQTALFAFMQYLKEESGMNQLQFCLSVEDFNKRILKEVQDNEIESLHKEAMDLYNTYFRSNSPHKVNVSTDIANEIFALLNGAPENVIRLRTTTPLFRAYEEVYGNLESKMCPGFYKSEEYFTFLLGQREKDKPENSSKNTGKDMPRNDRIGRGLTKIKHEVLGMKSMDGIVETTAPDPAFDMADMYHDGEDDPGKPPTSGFRDLSAWRVTIPRLTTGETSSGRSCFVFVLDVQRIDITSHTESDLHWCVERRYSEFYALESKLTEFHGDINFDDVRLPPRPKIFTSRGLDAMQSKMKPFEEYLSGLLQKPSLRGSELLYTFLTSKEEFSLAASNLGLGFKMIKNVKLTKEKGQGLQPFIDNFLNSTQALKPKPKFDSVIGNDIDGNTERLVEKHAVFNDNFDIKVGVAPSMPQTISSHEAQEVKTVFDTIVYLLGTVFQTPTNTLRLAQGAGIIIKSTFEHLVEWGISSKLSQVLCVGRMAFLCNLSQEALFEASGSAGRTDEDKIKRKTAALRHFHNFVRPYLQWIVGKDEFDYGTQFVFDGLQDPVINKHLAMQLVDLVLREIFPEIAKHNEL